MGALLMTLPRAVHTSDARLFKRLWLAHGGTIAAVRRTGEGRYAHPKFERTVRANDRRKDVPAVMLSRLNALLRSSAPAAAAFAKEPAR